MSKEHPIIRVAKDVARGAVKGFKGKKVMGTIKRKKPIIIKSKFELDEAKAKAKRPADKAQKNRNKLRGIKGTD